MIVKTETGSRYEVDSVKKQIRRLSGKNDPTPRIGNAEWRPYNDISDIEVGCQVLIVWTDDVELLEETKAMLEDGEHAVPTTLTSRIVEIEAS